jgi:uncharacterized membrane protein
MPFCAHCGAEGEGNFCPACGASRTAASSAASSAPAQLEDNLVSALCYVLGVLTGILFLVLEPYNKNRDIRFHAFQSIFTFGAVFVLSAGLMFLSYVPLLGLLALGLMPLLYLASFVLWVVLIVKAYNKERLVLPIVGPLAEQQA